MMVRSYRVPILRKSAVARKTVEVTLDTANTDFRFRAGQYARITLSGLEDQPLPQQFHDFSISSSPLDTKTLSFTYRRSASVFKARLDTLDAGSEVLLEGPFGILTLPASTDRPLCFIAAGIGITPMLSMIRYVCAARRPYDITLHYLNSFRESAAYTEELKRLAHQNDQFAFKDLYGRFDDNIEQLPQHPPNTIYYITGPPSAVIKARASLLRRGIMDENVWVEEFSGYHG